MSGELSKPERVARRISQAASLLEEAKFMCARAERPDLAMELSVVIDSVAKIYERVAAAGSDTQTFRKNREGRKAA